jgi:hypothetical protein
VEAMTITEFRNILLSLLDDSISAADFQRLEETLENSPAMRHYYYDFMLVHASLKNRTSHAPATADAQVLNSSDDIRSSGLWEALGEYERLVEPLDVPAASRKVELVQGVRDFKKQLDNPSHGSRTSLYVAITGLAALLLMILYVTMNPRFIPEPVATLTDTFNARWTDRSPEINSRLTNEKEPLRLLSGYAKLRFDNHAEVIIEGPADFLLVTQEQVYVNRGKLTAVIPPSAAGFRVDTPMMSVLDFGTEFCVNVQENGIGTVSMYEGKASILPGQAGTRQGSHMLTAGQARKVDSRTGQVEEIEPEAGFVRRLNSKYNFIWRGEPISLASLIAGGNGFEPVMDLRPLNPLTGEYEIKKLKSAALMTNQAYNPVPDNIFIDGVFIPDSESETIVISSVGHTWPAPATSGTCTYDIAVFFKRFDVSQADAMGPLFDGVLHWTETQPSVLLHSNVGITIDLQQIRKKYPNLNLSSLQTGYGCSWADRRGCVDFSIVVDGRVKHVHETLQSRKDSFAVRVDLDPNARFLTFIVTDSPKSSQDMQIAHEYDFFYLLNPQLQVN